MTWRCARLTPGRRQSTRSPPSCSSRRPGPQPRSGTSVQRATALARWQPPGQQARSGEVPAPAGTRACCTVTIWTDASGAITTPPPDHRVFAGDVCLGAVATWLIMSSLVLASSGLIWCALRLPAAARLGRRVAGGRPVVERRPQLRRGDHRDLTAAGSRLDDSSTGNTSRRRASWRGPWRPWIITPPCRGRSIWSARRPGPGQVADSTRMADGADATMGKGTRASLLGVRRQRWTAARAGKLEQRLVVEYGVTLDDVWLPLAMLRRLRTHGPWDAPFTEASTDQERVLLAHALAQRHNRARAAPRDRPVGLPRRHTIRADRPVRKARRRLGRCARLISGRRVG